MARFDFSNFFKRNRKQGFTLIELLVVIFIIGILVSIVVANLSDVRKNSRDKQRMADLAQIQLALENYYDDTGCTITGANAGTYKHCYPNYPSNTTNPRVVSCSLASGICGGSGVGITWVYLQAAVTMYLRPLPIDPIARLDTNVNSKNTFVYLYARGYKKSSTSCGFTQTDVPTDYILLAHLEGVGPCSSLGGTRSAFSIDDDTFNVLYGN